MRIVVIDDEELAVENLVALLQKVEPNAEVSGFSKANEALDYLTQNQTDIAFLDIELEEFNGIELAKKFKQLYSKINIIFVSAHSHYSVDAFHLHASGYLMKPAREADLRTEINNLRHPIHQLPRRRVRVQTFGHFEIFLDGELLKFTRIKCKECLAYLIDRKGARVTYADLSAILWEDRPFDRTVQNNTQKIVSDLMKTLKDSNIQDLIIKSRQDIAIDTSVVDCDYYSALSGDVTQMNAFAGEYMSNYSWAEFTLGKLIENGLI